MNIYILIGNMNMTELPKSHNLDCLVKLKKLVKSEEDRHYLIGLAAYIGSYNARKELAPQGFFEGIRDTVSRMYEAGYIVKKQREVIARLENATPGDLIKELESQVREIPSNNEVPESGLSGSFKAYAKISEMRELSDLHLQNMGKRMEKRIFNIRNSNEYSEYKRTRDERSLCRILLKEEEAIRHAVVFEINR